MANQTVNNVTVQIRRDTAQGWAVVNPVLAEGELGFETDTGKSKCGDGTTTWNNLEYLYALPSHEHTTEDIVPLETKTYTDLYANPNNFAGGSFYFAKVIPDDYYLPWKAVYCVTVTVPNQVNYSGVYTIEMCGCQSNFICCKAHNNFFSTSYRPIYNHVLYRATQAGFATYGHLLGERIYSATNGNNANYKRTFVVELLSQENCTITLFDNALKYADVSGTGSTNYAGYTEFNGTDIGIKMTGDANSNTYDRTLLNDIRVVAGTNGIFAYSLIMERPDGTWESLTTTGGQTTDRTKNSHGFLLGKIWRYNYSNNITSGNMTNNDYLYDCMPVNLSYSSNCGTTLTEYKPTYLVGTVGSDGLFYLDDNFITQTIPLTEDGKIYIYLGNTYNTSDVFLVANNTAYWYKDGAFREYVHIPSDYVKDSDLSTVATSGSYNDLSNKPTIPTVDSSLSGSSTNPVQNKVIKTALDGKVNTTDGFAHDDISWDLTNFYQHRLFQSKLDNTLYEADKRFTVTLTNFDNTASTLFDGNVETKANVNAGKVGTILIDGTANLGMSYPYGRLAISFYAGDCPISADGATNILARVYQDWSGHNTGWVDLTPIKILTNGYGVATIIWNCKSTYMIYKIEITIDNTSGITGYTSDGTGRIGVGSVEFFADRTGIHSLPVLTKWGDDTKYGSITLANSGKFIGDVTGNVSGSAGSVAWGNITSRPTFATVATSGSYNDLSDKPTIPSAYSLPIASSGTLGGIKVGNNLTIDNDGVLSATGGGGGGIQSITEGSTNGTISVDGTDVAVHGLGSNAYNSTSYLPLTGGVIQNNNTSLALRNKVNYITRGTTPSDSKEQWIIRGEDSAGNITGGVYKYLTTGNISSTRLYDYTNNTNSGGGHYIGVFHDADGNGYTYAPTPSTTDDSTKIATTAYVKNCVPKSIGSASTPVYTNSNGVITKCTSIANALFMEEQSLSSNGYAHFKGGVTIQWGTVTTNSNPVTITFPVAFGNYCRSFVGTYTYDTSDGGIAYSPSIKSLSKTAATVAVRTVYTSLRWIAIGY